MFRIASSSISLAGSEEQINFSQQSPKMLKMASKSFIHALLLFLGLFLKISRWVPLYMFLSGFIFVFPCIHKPAGVTDPSYSD